MYYHKAPGAQCSYNPPVPRLIQRVANRNVRHQRLAPLQRTLGVFETEPRSSEIRSSLNPSFSGSGKDVGTYQGHRIRLEHLELGLRAEQQTHNRRTHTNTHTDTHTHTHTYTRTHARTHTHTHARTHSRTHIHKNKQRHAQRHTPTQTGGSVCGLFV